VFHFNIIRFGLFYFCTQRERAAAVRSAAEYCRLHCVHSIRVLFDIAITSGHLSIFEDEKGGFPQIYPIYSLKTNQFSGETYTLICFIARKNHLNPMKIIHLFSC
ncbi:MAG: hypothetical protein J7F05_10745, partial [Trichodesmium erythraeum GBRTRLIN201]|nr:hypothetical protein [Trichodesmium erythraeum GBRTRLIN201]